MNNEKSKNVARAARHKRVRKKISGTAERPRLCVYRSLKNVYAQLIDDTRGVTLAEASTLSKEYKSSDHPPVVNLEAAGSIGRILAAKAKEKGMNISSKSLNALNKMFQ